VSTVTKDRILGKAWAAQLILFVTRIKCWARSVRKWLLQNQPREVAGFLPPIQPLLGTAPQLATTRAFQAGTAQSSLGMVSETMHIHLTHLAWVRGWAENQIPWCNAHNVRMGA